MSSLPRERQKSQVLSSGFLQNWDFYWEWLWFTFSTCFVSLLVCGGAGPGV